MGFGTNQKPGKALGLQNRGSNLNSRNVTLLQNNPKNKTNSSSVNQSTVNQQVKIIGKVPSLSTKGSPQQFTSKVNLSSLSTKDPPQQFTPKLNVQSLNTKNGSLQQFTPKANVSSLNTKDPPKLSSTTSTKDPSFGSNQTRDETIIRSFEEVTGRHLSSQELQELDNPRFVNSEDETHFIDRIEETTGRRLDDREFSEVSDENSDENNEENVENGSDIDFSITVISGIVNSLDVSDTMDTFLIGNTTIQLNPDLVGNFTLQNGENIKLDGYFTSNENFVVTQIMSVIQ